MSELSQYWDKPRPKKPVVLLIDCGESMASGSYTSLNNTTKNAASASSLNPPNVRTTSPALNTRISQEWHDLEAKQMAKLQNRYRSLIEGMAIPLYEELKPGMLFVCEHRVSYEHEAEEGVDSGVGGHTRYPSTQKYVWEVIEPGDTLLYVSQKRDEEDGEILPKWLITSAETGKSRVREVYIASYKLSKMGSPEK